MAMIPFANCTKDMGIFLHLEQDLINWRSIHKEMIIFTKCFRR